MLLKQFLFITSFIVSLSFSIASYISLQAYIFNSLGEKHVFQLKSKLLRKRKKKIFVDSLVNQLQEIWSIITARISRIILANRLERISSSSQMSLSTIQPLTSMPAVSLGKREAMVQIERESFFIIWLNQGLKSILTTRKRYCLSLRKEGFGWLLLTSIRKVMETRLDIYLMVGFSCIFHSLMMVLMKLQSFISFPLMLASSVSTFQSKLNMTYTIFMLRFYSSRAFTLSKRLSCILDEEKQRLDKVQAEQYCSYVFVYDAARNLSRLSQIYPFRRVRIPLQD